MTTSEQKDFLVSQLIDAFRAIHQPANANWGKMNFNQMLEHLIEACKNASGEIVFETFHTPEERLPAMQAFLMTDKLFKPETKNAMMGEEPAPINNDDTNDLLNELQSQINRFYERFQQDENLVVRNPIFGDLNEELWTRLLYKHCIHHLNQFQPAI